MCEAAWLGGVGPGEGSLGLTPASGVPVTALAQDRDSLLVCWPRVWNRSPEGGSRGHPASGALFALAILSSLNAFLIS